MKVKLVSTEEELQGLKEQWNRLVSSNPSTDYVFYSWEWFFYSWKYAGCPELFVVIALENDELVGVLPLLRTTVKRRGLKVRSLAFCPNGNTPRNDIYVSEKNEITQKLQVIETILQRVCLERKLWDILVFSNIADSTLLFSVLTGGEGTHQVFPHIIQTEGRSSPHVDISSYASFDEHLLKNVGQRRRTKLRRDIKRLDSLQKPWNIRHYSSGSQYLEGLRLLIDIRKKSWKSTPSQEFQKFLCDICTDPFFDGRLHIAILVLEDLPIAGQFYLIKNRCAQMLLNDHDEDYHENLVPGSNLTTMMLMYAFENQWSFFDFSGSAHDYKKWLSSGITHHSNFQLFHSGLKSRLIHWGKTSVLPWIRKLMPQKEQLNEQKASSEKTG